MSPAHRLCAVLTALAGFALLDVQPAKADSCLLAPYGEQLVVEVETITEDGIEIMDASYDAYTVLLEGDDFSEKTRLWVIRENGAIGAWWQDFE